MKWAINLAIVVLVIVVTMKYVYPTVAKVLP
jgi:hypothetical protein